MNSCGRLYRLSVVLLTSLLTMVLFLPVNAGSPPRVKTYTQPNANFSFTSPEGANMTLGNEEIDGSKKDAVTVRYASGWLAIKLFNAPLEKAIDMSGAMVKNEKGKWARPGRFGEPVEGIPALNPTLKGIYATSVCGISDKTGFHAGAGSCLSGFLSNGKQTAYFETDGVFPTDLVIRTIMPSFKLGAAK